MSISASRKASGWSRQASLKTATVAGNRYFRRCSRYGATKSAPYPFHWSSTRFALCVARGSVSGGRMERSPKRRSPTATDERNAPPVRRRGRREQRGLPNARLRQSAGQVVVALAFTDWLAGVRVEHFDEDTKCLKSFRRSERWNDSAFVLVFDKLLHIRTLDGFHQFTKIFTVLVVGPGNEDIGVG